MHSTKYEKLDYRSIPVFKSIQVFPRWQTNSLGVTNKKAPLSFSRTRSETLQYNYLSWSESKIIPIQSCRLASHARTGSNKAVTIQNLILNYKGRAYGYSATLDTEWLQGAFTFLTPSEFVGRPSWKYLDRIEYRYTAVVVRKQ